MPFGLNAGAKVLEIFAFANVLTTLFGSFLQVAGFMIFATKIKIGMSWIGKMLYLAPIEAGYPVARIAGRCFLKISTAVLLNNFNILYYNYCMCFVKLIYLQSIKF